MTQYIHHVTNTHTKNKHTGVPTYDYIDADTYTNHARVKSKYACSRIHEHAHSQPCSPHKGSRNMSACTNKRKIAHTRKEEHTHKNIPALEGRVGMHQNNCRCPFYKTHPGVGRMSTHASRRLLVRSYRRAASEAGAQIRGEVYCRAQA